MNTYRAYVVSSVVLYADIEAESEEAAWLLARELDGGSFVEVPLSGEWKLGDVEELDD